MVITTYRAIKVKLSEEIERMSNHCTHSILASSKFKANLGKLNFDEKHNSGQIWENIFLITSKYINMNLYRFIN